ncbi:MAG: putative mmpl domain protein [Streblomastix strix]|uniref:Putative mmpl domain protein n=1 Tax=Streblomastix strix TaxID=222440 RepID=A0A5J4W898_9EUKA|nr:MAG: putative mmpl domain protein [Streblomastix strix]
MKYSFFDGYIKFIHRARYFTLIFWLISLGFGLYFGFRIFNQTNNQLDAPSHTQAYDAKQLMKYYFPSSAGFGYNVAYFHTNNYSSILDITCLQNASVSFQDAIDELEERLGEQILHIPLKGYYLTSNEIIKSQFLSENKNGTFIILSLEHRDHELNEDYKKISDIFGKVMKEQCSEEELKSMDYGLIGMSQISKDTKENIISDLMIMDVICIPLAFVVLMIMLKSVRLIIITAFVTITAIALSFLIALPISQYLMQVPTFAPSIMMSICLALSIDYSLFLLSRFRDELIKGTSIARSIHLMTRYSGRIICLSGGILTLAFISNTLLKNGMLLALGICSAISTLVNLIVNITAVPAFLFAFPSFFSDFGWLGFGSCFSKISCCNSKFFQSIGFHELRKKSRKSFSESINYKDSQYNNDNTETSRLLNNQNSYDKEQIDFNNYQYDADSNITGSNQSQNYDTNSNKNINNSSLETAYEKGLLKQQYKSNWFRMINFLATKKHAIIVIVVILLAVVPFAVMFLGYMRQSLDNTQIFIHGSNTLKLFKLITTDFSAGMFQPYNLIINASATGGVMNDDFFDYAGLYIQTLLTNHPDIFNKDRIMSIVYAQGGQIIYEAVQLALDNECDEDMQDFCDALVQLNEQFVPRDLHKRNDAVLINLVLQLDPMGEESFNNLPYIYNTTRYFLEQHPAPGIDIINNNIQEVDEYQYNSLINMGNNEIDTISGILNKKWGPYKPLRSDQGIEIGIDCASVSMSDSVVKIYAILPTAMIISFSIVFILVGFIYRSVVVPFRTVFSLGATLLTVYGILVVVIQNHLLGWLLPYLKDADSLYFFVPVFGYSLVLGLALDYDIFLFYRIAEYRDLGYTDHAAIVKATSQSGRIITAAGLIMAIAFLGLLFSHMVVLIEFGLLLVVTVLLDTFIIRVFFVPAICLLLGKLNWFPCKRCEATKDVNDMSDQIVELKSLEEENEWLTQYMGFKQSNPLKREAE